jgi:hypothetical protein
MLTLTFLLCCNLNFIFLQPGSAGGVFAHDPWEQLLLDQNGDKAIIQNVTDDGSVMALIISLGGHHTDLMYSNPQDPECVREARQIEKHYITKWIQEWKSRKE